MRLTRLLLAAVVLLGVLALVVVARALAHPWRTATATAYASWEPLTGCVVRGRCRTACGGWLDDRAFTVAANPALGLRCGQRLLVCRYDRLRHPGEKGIQLWHNCRRATVTDRTASRFGFELSYALSRALGASRAGWDAPRRVRWRQA